jgi:hypothetical protein
MDIFIGKAIQLTVQPRRPQVEVLNLKKLLSALSDFRQPQMV